LGLPLCGNRVIRRVRFDQVIRALGKVGGAGQQHISKYFIVVGFSRIPGFRSAAGGASQEGERPPQSNCVALFASGFVFRNIRLGQG
jgi:hypothetical protein